MKASLLPVPRTYSFNSSISAKELIERLTGALQTSATVTGSLHDTTFVLNGRSQLAGGYQRHFYGHIVEAGRRATIEGGFRLLPAVRSLIVTLASLVLLAGLATSINQRSATPLLLILLVVLGGVLVLRYQLTRSALGEEAVLNLLITLTKD